MKSRKWAGIAALALIVAGLGISYYLFARGIKLAKGQAGSDFCNAVFETSCDGTLTSEYSHAFGLSLGGWGIVYFGALGVLMLGGRWLRDVFLRPALSAAMLANLAGLVVSGYLATLFLTGKVPLCPLCIATHAINLALFVMLLLYRGDSPFGFFTDARSAAVYMLAPGQSATPENSTRIVAFIATGLVALTLYFGLALRSVPPAPLTALPANGTTASGVAYEELVRNILRLYDDQEVTEVPIGPNDPRRGPADAPIQIVVFSDFECPSCKMQSHVLEELVKMYGNRLSIVAKNYPLNSDCNPAIASKPHRNACLAAYASVAANMQGQYWPFHDLVYRLKGSPTPDMLSEIAKSVHLDVPKFLSDMASDAAKAKVTEDVQLGMKLKATQTPWTYLNGKLLTSEIAAQLPTLVKYVAQKQAQQPVAATK